MQTAMEELEDFRRRIDALDDRIVRLLAERFSVVREVAALKAKRGIPVRLPDRIEEVLSRNAGSGAGQGLEPAFLRKLYAEIVEASCGLEDRLIDGDDNRADRRSKR